MHSLQPHLLRTPYQHCRHPRPLTVSQQTHKQQYMNPSHRKNCTHNIVYHNNLTDIPRTTTGLQTPHKHTDPAVKVREISSYCKSTYAKYILCCESGLSVLMAGPGIYLSIVLGGFLCIVGAHSLHSCCTLSISAS